MILIGIVGMAILRKATKPEIVGIAGSASAYLGLHYLTIATNDWIFSGIAEVVLIGLLILVARQIRRILTTGDARAFGPWFAAWQARRRMRVRDNDRWRR